LDIIKAVIAEDDFRVAHIHEKFLSQFNEIEVVGKALNAKETMKILREKQPDLLILDIYMPDRMGTELLADIRPLCPHMDIMIITAATDKAFIEKALHFGVDHYFIKPVTMEHFCQVIEDYLKNRQLLQTNTAINQELADRLFRRGFLQKATKETVLPKGIDEITLEKVKSVLQSDEGLSAEQVGHLIGASRTTARRYLEFLISVGECKAEAVYGIVGRPERKYYKISS
jgi:CitB family two-component system response regulator CitT